MKKIVFVFAGWALLSTGVYAAEILDMEAVKKLLTGNMVHGVAPNGMGGWDPMSCNNCKQRPGPPGISYWTGCD